MEFEKRTIKKADKPLLILEITESKEIAVKENIVINCSGYEKSRRKFGDGLAIFGTFDGSVAPKE